MNTDIGQVLLTELQKIHSRTYFDRAPRGTTFPYAVFSTPSSFQGQDKTQNIMLQIDVYDNKGNSITDLEKIVKDISTAFHKSLYVDSKMSLRFQQESILQIQEADEQMRRRRINFVIKYFSREV